MIRDILNNLGAVIGQLELPDETTEEQWAAVLAPYAAEPDLTLVQPVVTSFAADKAEVDQPITDDQWTKLTASRMLWDVESGFSITDSVLQVAKTGIYNFDFQMRLDSLVNVKAVEVALYQEVEGDPDDYWFTLKHQSVPAVDTVMQLGGMTQFDFFVGERYYVAVRLLPVDNKAPVSATIVGSDDHTAFGASFSTPLTNAYRE